MRKTFEFNLGQTGGEYFVTPVPGQGLGFFFIQRTRQDAIDAACRGIVTYLHAAKTPAKTKIQIEGTRKYSVEETPQLGGKKQTRYGGKPMKQAIPNETITVSVEV